MSGRWVCEWYQHYADKKVSIFIILIKILEQFIKKLLRKKHTGYPKESATGYRTLFGRARAYTVPF